MNVFIPGGWGFLFDVSMQIIFFGNLCEILFLSPEQKQNCSLIFPKLVVLFSGEFGCVSVPHIPLFLFSGLLKLLFLPDLLYQGSIFDGSIRVHKVSTLLLYRKQNKKYGRSIGNLSRFIGKYKINIKIMEVLITIKRGIPLMHMIGRKWSKF